jgi:transcriptional regulator with XRE-family HTH domain
MIDPSLEIGKNIKRRRTALALRLDDLAAQSGVSAAMLSEVERGVKNPTVRLAYQVARALGCTLTDLLAEETGGTLAILRASERRTLVDPETGVERHVLSNEFARRGIELLWYAIPPGQATGEMAPNRPGVLEHLTVLRGELTFIIDGEKVKLGEQDSATYGPVTAEYRNEGGAPCHYLIVIDSTRASGGAFESRPPRVGAANDRPKANSKRD